MEDVFSHLGTSLFAHDVSASYSLAPQGPALSSNEEQYVTDHMAGLMVLVQTLSASSDM